MQRIDRALGRAALTRRGVLPCLALTLVTLAACRQNAAIFGSKEVLNVEVTAQPLLGAATISQNFQPPASIQGIADAFTPNPPDATFIERYRVLGQLGSSVGSCEIKWKDVDQVDQYAAPGTPPSGGKLACPYAATPLDGVLYCYNVAALSRCDETLKLFNANTLQGVGWIMGTPDSYSYPACVQLDGEETGGLSIKDCAPRTDALIHLKRFSRFLASRYSSEATGKYSHFMAYNEVGVSKYFNVHGAPRGDGSGQTIDLANLSEADMQQWGDIYAGVMKAIHDGIQQAGRTDVMLYASFDQWFPLGGINQYILEALKSQLGVSRDWAIAIHPYGGPSADDPGDPNPDKYVFENLSILAGHMEDWLRSLNLSNVEQRPQAKLFPSEQSYISDGDSFKRDRNAVAEWICRAHDYAVNTPSIVAVMHNHFQSTPAEDAREDANLPPDTGNDLYFGLVESNISGDLYRDLTLETLLESAPGAAYFATIGNASWNRSRLHYCCQAHDLGCGSPPPTVEPVQGAWMQVLARDLNVVQ